MRARKNDSSRWKRWERYLGLASDVGAIAMSLRDRPTPLDWAALCLRAAGLVFRIRAEHREATAKDPWTYFEAEGLDRRWVEIPSEFRKLVMEHVTSARVEEAYWDGRPESDRVCLGQIGDEVVGWIQEREDRVVDGPYVLSARERETYAALGERLWQRLGTRHCAYTSGGLVVDLADCAEHPTTRQMRELEKRLAAFLAAGIGRSCLLVGPPGTGKSLGVQKLVRALGLTSLRVDLAVLERHHHGLGAQVVEGLETLLKVLAPGALILDDLDRVDAGGRLLHFLELAVRTCRLVLATANCPDRMMGAALRPGRFDEIVRVDQLDPEVLAGLLAPDLDLLDRFRELPVAYVAEYVKRRRVLGRTRALAEFDEVAARARRIDELSERGD